MWIGQGLVGIGPQVTQGLLGRRVWKEHIKVSSLTLFEKSRVQYTEHMGVLLALIAKPRVQYSPF